MLVDNILLSTGGCAANAGIDLAKLGVRVGVVGKTGNDVFADFIARELQATAWMFRASASAAAPTSRTVILPIIGDDRRYIHAVGANAEMKVTDVDLAQVARSKVLYVGGYMLFPGFKQEELVELFKFAGRGASRPCSTWQAVNPELGLEPLQQVLPFTDALPARTTTKPS